jgi:hypothetical protein
MVPGATPEVTTRPGDVRHVESLAGSVRVVQVCLLRCDEETNMAPDERSRVEATQALADQVGSAAAAALMECIPPFGWHEVAARRDLVELEERMKLRMEAMEARLEGRLDKAVSAQNRALVLVIAGAVFASVLTNLLT